MIKTIRGKVFLLTAVSVFIGSLAVVGICSCLLKMELPQGRIIPALGAVLFILSVVFGVAAAFIGDRMIGKPIRLLTKAAANYVGETVDNADFQQILTFEVSDIKSEDEIGKLRDALLQSEKDVDDYIEKLIRITVEKERIEAELDVARRIQESMLPSIFPAYPHREEFDIFASMNPAKEVGGDFYDFFLIDDTHMALIMADVSGKGIPGALFMMISKILLKTHTNKGMEPPEIAFEVNNLLYENNEVEMFVTVWLGIMDLETGHVQAINGGHEYPLIRRAGGEFELMKDAHSFVLGGFEDMKFKKYEFDLNAGDCLFLYTDGVPEATNSENELYGMNRALAALNRDPSLNPESLIQVLSEDIDEFVGEAPQADDITMMGVHIRYLLKD